MARLVATVVGSGLVVLALAGSAAGSRQADVLLATVEVPFAKAAVTQTALNLQPTVTYTFEISGFGEEKPKVEGGANSSYAYDAVYCFRSSGLIGADYCNPPTTRGQVLMVITPSRPGGTDFTSDATGKTTQYSPSHVYRVKKTGLQGIVQFVNERVRSRNLCTSDTRVCTGGFVVKVFGPEGGGAPTEPTGASAILATGGGDVKVQKAAGVWEKASAGIALAPGDKLHTGFKSTVVIRLPDGHTLAVHPMSMLLIQEKGYTLRQGEVEASVRRGRASSDFSVKTATTVASVRGTAFSALYDPPTRTTVYHLKSGSIVVTPNGRAPITMKPGQEIEVTPKGVTPGTFDRAGTPAGVIGRRKATALVLATLRRAEKACQLDASAEAGLVSLAHVARGWRASATLSGPASKLAVWTITGSTLKPVNADAFEIDNRCR